MEQENNQPIFKSFWTVIPTLLLEDSKIPQRAKKLYGLISSLCKIEGYCWASNKFLTEQSEIPLGTLRKYLKILERKEWIKSEITQEEGNKRKIFLILPDFSSRGMSTLTNNREHRGMSTLTNNREQRYVHAYEQPRTDIDNNIDNNNIDNNIDNNDTKVSLKAEHGNEDINYLISLLKAEYEIKLLDGSEKENRRFCWLALKKFKRSGVEAIIKIGAKDKFWQTRITGFKTLYHNGVKIASTLKEKQQQVVKI